MTPTTRHEITTRLDQVFKTSDCITDDEVRSHLARYLCILTSGYIESSIKIILRDFFNTNSSPKVANHCNTSIKNISNLKTEKISQLLNSFSSDWKDEFDGCISDKERDAVDSVVANRHLIAHGNNVGVSYIQIREWYKTIKIVIGKIFLIINK